MYTINEGTFKSFKGNIHLLDVPMFSIFFDKNILKNEFYVNGNPLIKNILEPDGVKNYLNTYEEGLKRLCAETKSYLGKIGFSSMHANVVISDLSNITMGYAKGSAGGNVDRKGRFIRLDITFFNKFNKKIDEGYAIQILAHEWAHMWMFRHSKEFNKTIHELYSKLVTPHLHKHRIPVPHEKEDPYVLADYESYHEIVEYLRKQVEWVDAYGMTNSYEFWATAIQLFFKLSNQHKKMIVNLISRKH